MFENPWLRCMMFLTLHWGGVLWLAAPLLLHPLWAPLNTYCVPSPCRAQRTQWMMTRDRHGFSLEQLADHRGVRKTQGGKWPREPSCQQEVLSEGLAVQLLTVGRWLWGSHLACCSSGCSNKEHMCPWVYMTVCV